MTGTLRTKTLSSGKSYYYINLSYKDPRTNKWKAKTISTGLEVKNNKRKAEALIKQILEQYAYLEDLPLSYDSPVDSDISFCNYLDIWLAGRKFEIKKAFFQSDYQNHDGYVFTWEDGRAYNPDYISKLFKKAMKSFGRPEITLHNLRHSCASMLINKGWDIKKLQYWLEHTDAQTTLNIYSHFIRQRLNASDNDLSQISLAAADLFA